MCTYRLYLPLSIAQDELEKPLFHDFTQFWRYRYGTMIILELSRLKIGRTLDFFF
jgi:hypothetical protein